MVVQPDLRLCWMHVSQVMRNCVVFCVGTRNKGADQTEGGGGGGGMCSLMRPGDVQPDETRGCAAWWDQGMCSLIRSGNVQPDQTGGCAAWSDRGMCSLIRLGMCSLISATIVHCQDSSIRTEPQHDKTCLREFPTRPDTNRPAQPQKLARVLKFPL